MADTEPYDVAIVGMGPVGGVLACLLGKRGHRVVVIERHASPYPLPRAVHFDHETARILQACGLGRELHSLSEPADVYEWRNARGDVLLRFSSAGMGPSGWPFANMFCQPELEAEIESAVLACPSVTVRRGWEVEDLHQSADDVTLTVRCIETTEIDDWRTEAAPSGETTAIVARYVVGCDGANSTVRQLLGAAMTDLGFNFDWLIVDVALHESRVFEPSNYQICDPLRPTTVVSGGPGRRRWEFMRLPDETIDELSDAARAWELLKPWDVTPDRATLERHAVYTFQAKWVEDWRYGRALLAGDAAHLTPPFAGQGMCSGLRDAANLAWKLDAALSGVAADSVLDAFSVERAANVRGFIEFAVELGRVICVADEVEAAQRDAGMIAAMQISGDQATPEMPGVSDGIIAPHDDVAGSLFIQGRVRVGGRTALFDDLVGCGWRLVTLDHELVGALSGEDVAWLSELGGSVVALGAEVEDVDGTYERWFAAHGVRSVLQRPDFYLFGGANNALGVTTLLDALRTMLTSNGTARNGVLQ
ncbi:MAG: bifunctional 3-(3-hydroxy-phenyl)propionate/3-hydroxycinnamic acid hydroxylase [Acidimicrobiales bacterium]